MKSVYSQVKVYMVGERMQTCRTTFVIYREALLQADENVADANDTAICSAWEDGDLFGEFGYDAEDSEVPDEWCHPCPENLETYVGDAAACNNCGDREDEELFERCQTGEFDYLNDLHTGNVQGVIDDLPEEAIVSLIDEDTVSDDPEEVPSNAMDPVAAHAAAEWLGCADAFSVADEAAAEWINFSRFVESDVADAFSVEDVCNEIISVPDTHVTMDNAQLDESLPVPMEIDDIYREHTGYQNC